MKETVIFQGFDLESFLYDKGYGVPLNYFMYHKHRDVMDAPIDREYGLETFIYKGCPLECFSNHPNKRVQDLLSDMAVPVSHYGREN